MLNLNGNNSDQKNLLDLSWIESIGKDNCWNAYDHLLQLENRYTGQMDKMRLIASTWTLLALAALGKLTIDAGLHTINYESLISGKFMYYAIVSICSCGIASFGILGLLFLDSQVFRELQARTFKIGRHLEEKFEELPRIRNTLSRRSDSESKGVTFYIGIYYSILLTPLCLITLFYLWVILVNVFNSIFFSCIAIIPITLLLARLVFKSLPEWSNKRNHLSISIKLNS